MPKKKPEIKVEIDYSRRNSEFCCWAGCESRASYPAPRVRHSNDSESGKEHFYFCLDHVRAYNSSWDFFSGMSQPEIEKFQKDAITGHRPTRAMRSYAKLKKFSSYISGAHPIFDFDEIFGLNAERQNHAQLPAAEKQALALLDLTFPVSAREIKKRYKSLAKLYHPDIAGGDKKSEDKFKALVEAYTLLKKSEYFELR